MMIRIFYLVFFIFPLFINAQEVIQITCDEDIQLEIDEINMTDEEIVKAKDIYFQKLLAQANQECISQLAQTDDLNVTQTNAGGSISGADIKKAKVSTATKTLGTPKLNNPTNKTVTSNSSSGNSSTGNLTNQVGNNTLANGTVPSCIANIKDNNQVSVQLKESIAKENDPLLKKELIRKYAIYNNLKPEKLKC